MVKHTPIWFSQARDNHLISTHRSNLIGRACSRGTFPRETIATLLWLQLRYLAGNLLTEPPPDLQSGSNKEDPAAWAHVATFGVIRGTKNKYLSSHGLNLSFTFDLFRSFVLRLRLAHICSFLPLFVQIHLALTKICSDLFTKHSDL